jgi:hypothetical protein
MGGPGGEELVRSAKFVILWMALLCLACQEPTRPGGDQVSGVVRYGDGTVVKHAKVSLTTSGVPYGGLRQTWSDSLGRYEFLVSALGDTVNLYAQDGFDGLAHGAHRVGFATVVGHERVITQDIVLLFWAPI